MLIARLFSKIYKKGGIVLIDADGQKFICGNPNLNNPLTLKILNKKLNSEIQAMNHFQFLYLHSYKLPEMKDRD